MKLLQINVTANWGSTGRIAEGIGNTAEVSGFESWMAYGRYANPSRLRLLRIGSRWDYLEHGVESRLLDNHGLASRRATAAFLKQVRKIQPDIIHLHNIHGYYLNYPMLFHELQLLQVPVIWTLHDCWPFTGHCCYYSVCGCNRWQTACHDCPQTGTFPSCYILDRSAANFQLKKEFFTSLKNLFLVPVSRWLDHELSQSFLKDIPRQVIYNGIDTEAFSPSAHAAEIREMLHIRADQTVLLGVASVWSERKGLKDFIELSRRLKPHQKIVLIGLSPKQIKALPDSMIGIARTQSVQQLADFYSAADIVLNLSAEETFGLTTVEGFACGTPGIVYNTTASPELITSSTGFVVPQGDLDSVLTAVEEIENNGKSFYQESCRNHAITCFNQKNSYSDYIHLYQKLLKQI